MRIGILADTHDNLPRTRRAVEVLRDAGAELLVHCGDLTGPPIVEACATLPLYFTFGNHDGDMVGELERAAKRAGAVCLRWGGEFVAAGKRIAVAHGHLSMDLRPLLKAEPDYLLSGHSHAACDWREGKTRRINPGALFRAETHTVALLDVAADEVKFLTVE